MWIYFRLSLGSSLADIYTIFSSSFMCNVSPSMSSLHEYPWYIYSGDVMVIDIINKACYHMGFSHDSGCACLILGEVFYLLPAISSTRYFDFSTPFFVLEALSIVTMPSFSHMKFPTDFGVYYHPGMQLF